MVFLKVYLISLVPVRHQDSLIGRYRNMHMGDELTLVVLT